MKYSTCFFILALFLAKNSFVYCQPDKDRIIDPVKRVFICRFELDTFKTAEEGCTHWAQKHLPQGYKSTSTTVTDNGSVKCICKKQGDTDNDQQGMIYGVIVCPELATEIVDETTFFKKRCECPTPDYRAKECKCKKMESGGAEPERNEKLPTESTLKKLNALTPVRISIPAYRPNPKRTRDTLYGLDSATIRMNRNAYKITGADDPQIDALVDSVAARKDKKGAYTEDIALKIVQQMEGYVICPGKLNSNQGFDLVAFKACNCDETPKDVIIMESKPMHDSGHIILSETGKKDIQMSQLWIAETILQMQETGSEAVKIVGDKLAEFDKTGNSFQKYVIAVEKSTKTIYIVKLGNYSNAFDNGPVPPRKR